MTVQSCDCEGDVSTMKRKLLSILLALSLCLGLSLPALAAEGDFVIEDGVLMEYTGAGGTVVVPDGVTEIGEEAFYGFFDMFNLRLDVTLPSSVKVVGKSAFMESTLTSISLPEGLTTIEDEAFSECTQLTSVKLPGTLKTIGYGAFDYCTKLSSVTLPSGLKEIGQNAFSFCPISRIDIPAGVTIGRGAFVNTQVEKATIGGKAPTQEELTAYFFDTPLYYGIGSETEEDDLGNTQQLGGDPAPSETPDQSQFTIEDSVLIRCSIEKGTVTVPDGVTVIGDGENSVFQRGVTRVDLPDSVEEIAPYSFNESTIQEITIPTGVTEIPERAFWGCKYLKKVTMSSVETIGAQAFLGCNLLSNVTFSNSLTAIGEAAFRDCTSLAVVRFPASLREIGADAFHNCPLTSVELPKGLKKLGNSAFAGSKLTSITLPEGLEEMSGSPVYNCPNLTSITFPKTGKAVENMKDMTASQFLGILNLYMCPALEEIVNPPSEQLANRLNTYHSLFEGVDPSRWVTPQSEAIVKASNEITRGIKSDYEKARAIHEWVARNVVYDYEYHRGDKADCWTSAEDVLEHKLTVCAGYTALTQALLQAQGIPAVYVHGAAGGGGHAWNAAYINDRWIWIDSTWGRPGTGEMYNPQYFDPSDLFLAKTHAAMSTKSNNFKTGDPKAEVVNEERPDPKDLPSSWAQDSIDTAIRDSLIPSDLQGAYQRDITREEFCRLMVVLVEKKTGMSAESYALSKDKEITDPFTDTDNADILAAHALGIVNGTSKTTFNPSGSITRQEAASMLARTAQVLDMTSGQGQSFGDEATIASWAREGVAFTSGLVDPTTGDRVMGGTGNGNFSPLATYTREQAYITALRLSHCQ